MQHHKRISQEFWIEKCLESYETGNLHSKESILNLILFF